VLKPTLRPPSSPFKTDPQDICTAREQDVEESNSKEPVNADQGLPLAIQHFPMLERSDDYEPAEINSFHDFVYVP